MWFKPRTCVLALAVFALSLNLAACSRKGTGAGAPGTAVLPGMPDCYKTTGAAACPRDPSHPSGLPRSGAVCALPTCQVCGSDKAPAYRDETGAPQVGWCICVEKSETQGVSTYSCGPVGVIGHP